MRIVIYTTIFVLSGISAFSQKHFIGLRTGLAFTDSKNDLFEDSEMRIGINAGFTYDYFLTDNVSLGAELTFSQRGFKDDFYLRSDQNEPIGTETFRFDYNYIAIPLKVSYSGNSRFYGFAAGGLIPAFIVNASHEIPEISGIKGGKLKVTDLITAIDLAGMLEVGAGYKIKARYRIFVSLAGQFSMNRFTNDDYFAGVNARHYGFTLSAGMKYALSGKD